MQDVFDAAGAVRDAYARVDWTAGALGAVTSWSPTLISATTTALRTRFPVTLLWGPDYLLVYNEAYAPLIADKHPHALGSPAQVVFPEIWDTIGPMLDTVAAGHGATWTADQRLLLNRHGYLEECYFTFSFSAVTDPTGRVEGIMAIASETTGQVVGNRRLDLLRRLNAQLSDVEDPAQILDRALPVLRGTIADLPAADLIIAGLDRPGTDRVPGLSPLPPGHDLLLTPRPAGPIVQLRLPTGADTGPNSTLIVQLSPQLPADDACLGFVRLLGASLAQALDRVHVRQTAQRLSLVERDMSETLQRSLLTPSVQPDHLHVAVRYQPAIAHAHIGGDWYDSFLLPDGTLTVVVGDVSGHDRNAAAAMAQLRNLLRGIAVTLRKPPSQVLAALDEAITTLAVDALATAVLAQVEQSQEQAREGLRTLRWSNAGHPPPALLTADGAVRLLHSPPQTMLGIRGTHARSDHTVTLEPGCSVVFYTDGLIERRTAALDDSLDQLLAALAGRQDLTAEQLCDHLLEHFAHAADDDIVLLVVHAYPQDAPRPAAAGPRRLPDDVRRDAFTTRAPRPDSGTPRRDRSP